MKKIMLVLAAATLMAGNTFAQYKPEAGSVSTEVQFNPFDQDGNTFKLDGLKLRYFITENDALRIKLGITTNNSKNIVKDQSPEENTDSKWSSEDKLYGKSGDFSLDFGYERHFNVSKRISIYAGAGIGFNRHYVSSTMEGFKEYSSKAEDWKAHKTSYKDELTNGLFNLDDDNINDIGDRAFWGIKAGIFTGIDFYVYKGLYVGTELGLNVSSIKFSEMKYKSEETIDKVTTTKEEKSKDDVRSTTVRIEIQPTLRLGWTF